MSSCLAGGGRDRTDPAKGSEACFGLQPLRVVAGCQQQLRGGLVADRVLRHKVGCQLIDDSGDHAVEVADLVMRVILRSWSRRSSGAQTTVLWIICSATRRAATAVFRHAFRTRRDSIMPSRLLGVTVRLPVKAAWAAFWASRSSFLPRLRRSPLSGVVTSRTSTLAFCR